MKQCVETFCSEWQAWFFVGGQWLRNIFARHRLVAHQWEVPFAIRLGRQDAARLKAALMDGSYARTYRV